MENPFEIILERLDRIEYLLKQKEKTDYKEIHRVMNLNQASEYLSISKSTMYKLTSKHEIPHSKRAKKIYFDKTLIDEWVLNQRVKTNEELEEEVNRYLLKKRHSRR